MFADLDSKRRNHQESFPLTMDMSRKHFQLVMAIMCQRFSAAILHVIKNTSLKDFRTCACPSQEVSLQVSLMGNKATPLPHSKGSVRGSLLFFVILHLTENSLCKPRDLSQSAALCGTSGFKSYRRIDMSICIHADPACPELSMILERSY